MTFVSKNSLGLLFASELFASVVGFGVMVILARRLGPSGFADYEYGLAVAAWWLVVVRGGFDSIVYREAARRPRLVRPLTDVLIGLRLASALVAMTAVLGFAWASGGDRGWVVATAGLVVVPSALASDVGLRALGRFGGLALAQAMRAVGLGFGVAWLVTGPGDASVAAAFVVMAEVGSSAVLLLLYRPENGWIRPRFRRRAWSVLALRGAVAGASRFARVGLYAADLLILGALASATLGPYAAARRVAFALLALGLVVPSAVAPQIARAWTSGANEARSVITRTFAGMMLVALPATVGLMATADRWMPRLFGESFREGGPWLVLIAARLPFVLASNVQQAALIACRREGLALRLVMGMVGLAVVVIPPLALVYGAWGVGLGVLGVEVMGAICGWLGLRSLGVAPPWHHASGPAFAGCGGLVAICWIGREWPLAGVVVAGAGVYWGVVQFFRGWTLASSSPLPLEVDPGVMGVELPPAREHDSGRAGLALPMTHDRQGEPRPTGKPSPLGGRWAAFAPASGRPTS
jgi:O-antigen/teichoic acid export membrane protein